MSQTEKQRILLNLEEESTQDLNVIDESTYIDRLAPLSDQVFENDFSSSSLLKNQGPNLTAEMLSQEFG